MNPELKLAAHMDKEDAQDNLEMEIEQRAESLFNRILDVTGCYDDCFADRFMQSCEFADSLIKFTDRIAREELEG